MNVNQVLPKLTAASELNVAHRTRELGLFSALLALVSRQGRFPRVFLTARIAGVLAAIPLVITGSVTWKERAQSACVLGIRSLVRLHSYLIHCRGVAKSSSVFLYFLERNIFAWICHLKRISQS